MIPTMRKHLLLVLAGFAQSILAFALTVGAATMLLDNYTTDTAFGTAIQIVPFALIAVLFFAYPTYLLVKKRPMDALLVLCAAAVAIVSTLAFARVADGPHPDDGHSCYGTHRDELSDEEKLACPNWCPYKGPLLGGNYWAKDGEQCVYM